jgi:Bacterial type II/III secretion system short domain
MDSFRRTLASFLAAVFLVAAVAAQAQTPEVSLHAYALKYRRAGEAVALVSPLLSPYGTVELQPRSNTLVVRDTAAALRRITPVLLSFDHPARPLTLEIYIVRASRSQVSPAVPRSDLPDPLTKRLRSLLTYDIYEVQAQAQLASLEGQAVTYALAEDYKVSFSLGTVFGDQRVKLSDFRIVRRTDRRAPGAALIHTNLNLRLDQTMSLGLARSESSPEALMVVLTLRNGEVSRRLQRAESQ